MQAAAFGEALDLHDDHTAGIVHGGGDGQHFQGQGFAFHGDVAIGIGSGAADQSDIDGEGLVEQIFAPGNGHQFDQVLGGAGVHFAAAKARINEGAQPDCAECAGLVGGDVAEQVRDHPLRQVIGLDLAADGQTAELGHQPPMATDRPLDQPLMAEAVQTTFLAIALAGGIDQGEVARLLAI